MTKVSKQAALVAEANALKAEIARLEAELAKRTAMLAASTGNTPGKVTTECGSFTVRENNTYDEAVMREALGPGQQRRCQKTVLDKAKVKVLYPEVYAKAKVSRGHSVSLG